MSPMNQTGQIQSIRKLKLSVFQYLNYREFLKEFYQFQKSIQPNYSYRAFALKAKLSSSNYLKLVIDGQRRLTDKMLPHFVKGLGLNNEESKYFRLIVLFQETEDPNEKRELLEKIQVKRNRILSKSKLIDKSQELILKRWTHWVLREMVLLEKFNENPAWIAQKLQGEVTAKQAEESLALLKKIGFLEKKQDKWVQTEARISTEDEVINHLIRDLHAQFIERGLKSLYKDPLCEREFAGLTIALAENQIPKFKEKLKKFRQDLNSEFSMQDNNTNRIYHLQLMFFPVTKGDTP